EETFEIKFNDEDREKFLAYLRDTMTSPERSDLSSYLHGFYAQPVDLVEFLSCMLGFTSEKAADIFYTLLSNVKISVPTGLIFANLPVAGERLSNDDQALIRDAVSKESETSADIFSRMALEKYLLDQDDTVRQKTALETLLFFMAGDSTEEDYARDTHPSPRSRLQILLASDIIRQALLQDLPQGL
ncbi:MAG: hypothetical protein J6Y94_07470, partial [Bacteriovoracaceae bacterium]|nr:hypothetical protein [Bacteriovoracaceae bacterium]